jgi:hypothetical protein
MNDADKRAIIDAVEAEAAKKRAEEEAKKLKDENLTDNGDDYEDE